MVWDGDAKCYDNHTLVAYSRSVVRRRRGLDGCLPTRRASEEVPRRLEVWALSRSVLDIWGKETDKACCYSPICTNIAIANRCYRRQITRPFKVHTLDSQKCPAKDVSSWASSRLEFLYVTSMLPDNSSNLIASLHLTPSFLGAGLSLAPKPPLGPRNTKFCDDDSYQPMNLLHLAHLNFHHWLRAHGLIVCPPRFGRMCC